MLFNSAKTRDFVPTLKLDNEDIEVVEELKLLGVLITADLKWTANTTYITKRAYNKLWILRRLKQNGANRVELKDIYIADFKKCGGVWCCCVALWTHK